MTTRLREHLARHEMRKLLAATRHGRYPARNYAMALLTWRHGFRACEICDLRLSDLDLTARTIYCRRRKNSNPSLHPLMADEIRALASWLRKRPDDAGDLVFVTERDGALSPNTFWRLVRDAGRRAGFAFPVYAHMLRHSCGFQLANRGRDLRLIQDYLGHRYVQNTVRYTRVNPGRFSGLW